MDDGIPDKRHGHPPSIQRSTFPQAPKSSLPWVFGTGKWAAAADRRTSSSCWPRFLPTERVYYFVYFSAIVRCWYYFSKAIYVRIFGIPIRKLDIPCQLASTSKRWVLAWRTGRKWRVFPTETIWQIDVKNCFYIRKREPSYIHVTEPHRCAGYCNWISGERWYF